MRRNADITESPANEVEQTEAAGFVTFCVRQIEAAVNEATRNLDMVSDAILAVHRKADGMLASTSAEATSEVLAHDDLKSLQASATAASLQLQSLDRFHQRLGNACSNLARMAALMNSGDSPITDEGWQAFLVEARMAFTMDIERQMFDTVFECHSSKSNDEWAQDTSTDLMLF